MANVLLTEACVRSCPYCFAKQYMSETDVKDALSWDNIIYITDLLQSSGEKHISLLGGEPLIHPNVADMIVYLNKRGLDVTVFTSGIMPDEKFQVFVQKILSYNDLHVSFVCNVNEPQFNKKSDLEKIKRFFEFFANRTSLSFNIYRLDFDMSFLIDYIIDYGLNRHIRLGLAHPIPGEKNLYIKPDKFGEVKNKLMQFFAEFEKYKIVPGFDCGFPMCMFNDEDLGKIFKYSRGQVSFQCGPAIDIGTDLSVWSCFPLSGFHKKSLFEFSSFQEIAMYYGHKIEEVRKEIGGIYESCDTCLYREENICSGGCVAHILNGFIEEGNIRYEDNNI